MQRSDLPPNGSVCAGTHAPYAFRCGKDEESAQHATVAMRIESYDANWGYFTQAGPPSAREPRKTLRQAHGKSKCLKWFGFQPSPSGDGIGFPTCKKHRDRRICQEIIGNQQTSAECGDLGLGFTLNNSVEIVLWGGCFKHHVIWWFLPALDDSNNA